MRTCPFTNCVADLPDHLFACRKHWQSLPRADRLKISDAYAAGNPASRAGESRDSMSEEAKTPEAVWAVVELMGHVRLAGRLTEEERFGAKMGRLDIPTDVPCPRGHIAGVVCDVCHGQGVATGFVTQFFGGGSVYRITLVTEEVARHVAKKSAPAPVHPWDFPKQLAPHAHPNQRPHDDADLLVDRGDDGSDLE